MATEFKRVTMADVPTTALPNTTNANSDLYRPAATVDTVVIGLLLTNTSASSVTADVGVIPQDNTEGPTNASTQENFTYLIKGAQIPVGSALEIISGKVVIANTTGTGSSGDILCVRASLAASLDATVSVLENT